MGRGLRRWPQVASYGGVDTAAGQEPRGLPPPLAQVEVSAYVQTGTEAAATLGEHFPPPLTLGEVSAYVQTGNEANATLGEHMELPPRHPEPEELGVERGHLYTVCAPDHSWRA